MFTATIALLCVILLFVIFKIVHFLKVRNILNKLPGPIGYYAIGNIHEICGDSLDAESMYKAFRKFSSQYRIYRLWFSYICAVCMTDPKDVEVAISGMKNLTKSRSYEVLHPWLNSGLLTSSDDKWHTRRKLLTPSFHFNILQQFSNIIGRQTELLLEELDAFCGKEFDALPLISSFTLRTICETAMGIKFDVQKELQETYESNIQKMCKLLVHRLMRPWLYINAIYPMSPTFWNTYYTSNILHKFTKQIIQKRKDKFVSIENSGAQKKLAMLDLLLSKNDIIDMNGIREEVDTFVFEGHDTTSASLTFTLMLLANHQDIQTRVYNEIEEVLGSSTVLPNYQELQNLSYMEMCIKESLRLYPSVPTIGRLASQDIKTPSGYLIPKGVEIVVHIFDLHRNSDVYTDPEQFDPDRFLPENVANRHPFAYLPFSGGPRNCIGQKFAMAEMKICLTGIVRKFIIEPVDTPNTIILTQDVLLRPKNGVKIKLKLRKHNNAHL